MDGISNLSDENTESDIYESLKGLKNSEYHQKSVNKTILGIKFKDDFSDNLNSGRGRDDLLKYLDKHINGEYDDIDAWDYEIQEMVDLKIYLLDQLHENKEMFGKQIVSIIEEFIEEDGEPSYLENFDATP